MKRFFVVDSDCLGIVQRLKEIDKDYFLVFDLDKKKFELHNSSQVQDTYCLTFEFEQIDERMLEQTLRTRVQNSDAFFEEMEKENDALYKQIVSTTLNTFKESLNDC